MSEKHLPPADQVKCFLLTSPFIEPAKGSLFRRVTGELTVWQRRYLLRTPATTKPAPAIRDSVLRMGEIGKVLVSL